jgi:fibronectin type 3 domain-containing protein
VVRFFVKAGSGLFILGAIWGWAAVSPAANVTLSWDPVQADGLAAYRAYWGTNSGAYPWSMSVAANTATCSISNIQSGQTYYFAVTSSNTAGLESAYSGEVSYAAAARVNTPPAAQPQSITTTQNVSVLIQLSGTDANGDPLTFAVTKNPANGRLSGTAPILTYTPNTNYYGSDQFSFVANDGLTNSPDAVISISVVQSAAKPSKPGKPRVLKP